MREIGSAPPVTTSAPLLRIGNTIMQCHQTKNSRQAKKPRIDWFELFKQNIEYVLREKRGLISRALKETTRQDMVSTYCRERGIETVPMVVGSTWIQARDRFEKRLRLLEEQRNIETQHHTVDYKSHGAMAMNFIPEKLRKGPVITFACGHDHYRNVVGAKITRGNKKVSAFNFPLYQSEETMKIASCPSCTGVVLQWCRDQSNRECLYLLQNIGLCRTEQRSWKQSERRQYSIADLLGCCLEKLKLSMDTMQWLCESAADLFEYILEERVFLKQRIGLLVTNEEQQREFYEGINHTQPRPIGDPLYQQHKEKDMLDAPEQPGVQGICIWKCADGESTNYVLMERLPVSDVVVSYIAAFGAYILRKGGSYCRTGITPKVPTDYNHVTKDMKSYKECLPNITNAGRVQTVYAGRSKENKDKIVRFDTTKGELRGEQPKLGDMRNYLMGEDLPPLHAVEWSQALRARIILRYKAKLKTLAIVSELGLDEESVSIHLFRLRQAIERAQSESTQYSWWHVDPSLSTFDIILLEWGSGSGKSTQEMLMQIIEVHADGKNRTDEIAELHGIKELPTSAMVSQTTLREHVSSLRDGYTHLPELGIGFRQQPTRTYESTRLDGTMHYSDETRGAHNFMFVSDYESRSLRLAATTAGRITL